MYNIEQVRTIIEEKGCKLITKEYKDSKTKMEVLCSCGKHTFWVNLNAFMQGKFICDECMTAKSGKRKWTLEKVREYALNEGVEVLSKEYKNQKDKLKFKCISCGKPFETDWQTFINNEKYTCNSCSRKRGGEFRKLTYEDVKQTIEDLGSELFSKEYINADTPIKVRCTNCGKPIYNRFGTINYRKTIRCHECGYKIMGEKQTYTYEQVKEIIDSDESGCKLISTEYNGYKEELEILCGCGKNTIKTTLDLFQTRNKRFCPECGGQVEWDIEKAKEYVSTHSDCKLLANEYISQKTKMLFLCECGNEFETDMSTFIYKDKHQCNECSTVSILERNCIKFFEKYKIDYIHDDTLYGLINPKTNGVLRYDFILKRYNLVIECQGIQHEKSVQFYTTTEKEAIEKFEEQKYRDEIKRKYAEDNKIDLLYIWYYELDSIPEILKNKLKLN